jgi:protein-disulfide isomerase
MRGQARLAVPVSERDHIRGPSNAPVTLVEYGDYECPYCGQAYAIVKQLQQELGDQVRFVFRNFPLPEIHPHAEHAAEAAEAAADQGKFWNMHDHLFEHQSALDFEHLADYARILSLNEEEFEQDLEDHAESRRVRDDVRGGLESGVEGTPTFFINGVRYDGSYDLNSLRAAILNASANTGRA